MAATLSPAYLSQGVVRKCFTSASHATGSPEQNRILAPLLQFAATNAKTQNGRSVHRCSLPKCSRRCQKGATHLSYAVATGEEANLYLDVNGRREIDKSETLSEDPYGSVESAMTSQVVTTSAEETLDNVLEHFEHYTGLPVTDEEGRCIGIISNIDVARYARGKALSLPTTQVKDVMTSPVFVIMKGAPIAYAAGLMLQHKVHRIPVVDNEGVVVGIVTRTDLFQPLLPKVNGFYHRVLGHHDDERRSYNE